MKSLPSIQRLREVFSLRADGELFWRHSANRRCLDRAAGKRHKNGYMYVTVDGKTLRNHRAVFAIVHGRWPSDEIDHINGVKHDNRPENLREATRSQNAFHRGIPRNNTSGIRGVCWNKNDNRWRAKIDVQGRQIYLGSYKDIALAKFVYETAAMKYHGEFSRVFTESRAQAQRDGLPLW